MSVYTDTTWSYLENSLNPWNYAGALHNRVLDYVDDHTSATCGPDSLEWRLVARDALQAEGMICSSQDYDSLPTRFTELATYWHSDSLPVLYSWAYDGQGLSSAERAVLDSIEYVAQNEQTLTSMLSRLDAIETSILNTTSLTSSQKALPLFAVSIAKHSAGYWWGISEGVGGYGDGYGKVMKTQNAFNQLIEADLTGAIGGAVGGFLLGATRGFLIGLCGGPEGAVGGAAIGALTLSAGGAITGGTAASMAKGFALNKAKSLQYGGGKKK